MKLSVKELYEIRMAILKANRAAFEAQRLDLEVQELSIEIEVRHGVLDRKASIDFQTGEITVEEEQPEQEM